jgi:fumarate reductase flavoprotein subunit
MGYRGMIHVRVGMENGAITEISVIESGEDSAIGGAAIEELTDLVLMYNTTEIDAVSGATETSRGFLEAVENAIFSP